MIQSHSDRIALDQVQTLDGLFRARAALTPEAIGYRYFDATESAWRDVSWQEMAQITAQWRAALQQEGLQAGDRVALMLANGCQWVQFEQAALSLGLVVVPLYVNDRPENIAYILNDTESRLLLLTDNEQWQSLAPSLNIVGSLQRVVTLRPVPADDARLISVAQWLPAAFSELQYRDASADDLATIVYTSGTVGRPKGVMLSHRNILWNAAACLDIVPIFSDDLFLSFLPLSHMLERTVGYILPMMAGARVVYARSIPHLADDLLSQRPTVLISVPRIYERIYDRIFSQLEDKSFLQRSLFRLAVSTGWLRFEHQQGRGHWRPGFLLWPLLKRLVADKVMVRLGGCIRVAVCGGAPLATDVARLFIGLGLPLLNGYGMTETAPVLNANRLQDNNPAGVGPPLAGVEETIADDDELLARSPGVMLGYWRNEEATRAIIDSDGWLHTGDKACMEQGHVRITGRLKDIIVLSNGEKVPPADMEMAIALDPFIDQVMIIGEGRPFLTALLVLAKDQWPALAAQCGVLPDDVGLKSAVVAQVLCQRAGQRLREFPGYAQVRRVAALQEIWSTENGLLTPTLKLRRNRIQEHYSALIEQLYEGH